MNRRISVYRRKRDGIYVIPDGTIAGGGLFHTEPFEYLPLTAASEEIWAAIGRALVNANRVVPQPKSFDDETAWYRKAGVKTWREFAGKADVFSLVESDSDYTFVPLDWERGVLVGCSHGKLVLPRTASRDELIAAIDRCLKALRGGE